MQEIKLWKITENEVEKVSTEKLDYENRLENWIIKDISIISSNLVLIGSQVITDYGKIIDILAMNPNGELVIIELKRDKTYREVIAQGLDYATWVKDLTYDDLNLILNKHNKSDYSEISELYSDAFNKDADDIEFNSDHKILIVGSEIDDSTTRIIKYLSGEPYLLNINALNFNYYKDSEGNEFLAQAFIIPEETLIEVSKSKKRKRAKSIITNLFAKGKLNIGDKVYLKPGIEQGHKKETVCAKIVNTNQNCLQREQDSKLYSFSKLRHVFTDELNLKGVKKFWGFGIRDEWETEKGITLNSLLND